MNSFQTIDPSLGQVISTFDFADEKTIEQTISEAHQRYLSHKSSSFAERSAILLAVAQDLEQNALSYAKIMAQEMGKPLNQGEQEVKKCAWVCRFYAEKAQDFLANETRVSDAKQSLVRKDPLGIILAIMPWNFPFWQVFRVAAPTLMAGNVILLKHAANTPQCALAIENIFARGLGKGLLSSLFLSHDDARKVIADQRIKGVTLTGSNKAGIEVAQVAARYLKPFVLELGGSDPFIVFPDTDLKNTAAIAAVARCQNSGQSCIAAKRFIIHEEVYRDFTRIFVQKMKDQVMGNPMDKNVTIGPQASKNQRDRLHEQVIDAKDKGANILCGGEMALGPGYFYPPTVLENITPSMKVWTEETFGPVAALTRFKNDEEAIKLANDTRYGLGASIWTTDKQRMEHFSANLECGNVFINEMVKSDPRLPFGGTKESGLGRELGPEGITSFVNIKTVWINT